MLHSKGEQNEADKDLNSASSGEAVVSSKKHLWAGEKGNIHCLHLGAQLAQGLRFSLRKRRKVSDLGFFVCPTPQGIEQ